MEPWSSPTSRVTQRPRPTPRSGYVSARFTPLHPECILNRGPHLAHRAHHSPSTPFQAPEADAGPSNSFPIPEPQQILRLTANLFFGNVSVFRDEFYASLADDSSPLKVIIIDAQVCVEARNPVETDRRTVLRRTRNASRCLPPHPFSHARRAGRPP